MGKSPTLSSVTPTAFNFLLYGCNYYLVKKISEIYNKILVSDAKVQSDEEESKKKKDGRCVTVAVAHQTHKKPHSQKAK